MAEQGDEREAVEEAPAYGDTGRLAGGGPTRAPAVEEPDGSDDDPGVIVPYDGAVGGQDFECGLSVGFDALIGVAAVDEAEVGIRELVRWGEGERVAAELVDAGGGGMVKEGKAGGGAGEAHPLFIPFAESRHLGLGVIFGEIQGVD